MQKLLFVFVMLFASAVSAVEVTGLYEVEIPVADQQRPARVEAIRAGLGQVLIRVSGRGDVVLVPEISASLEHSAKYLQQYRYRSTAEGTGRALKPGEQLLWVRFDKGAVDRLLEESGLPVWGQARPSTLMWVAVENHGQRELLGSTVENEFRDLLESRAQRRGLPIQFPLLDLQDQRVKVSDVWGNFGDTLLMASRRYQNEAVLVGRVYFDAINGMWRSRWSMYRDGLDNVEWEAQGGALAEALDPGIDGAVGVLTASLMQAYEPLGGESVILNVTEVRDLTGYAKVQRYLQSLAMVESVQVVQVEPSNITFRLKVNAQQQALSQAIALGSTLVAAPSVAAPPAEGEAPPPITTMYYRYLP